MLNSGQAGKSMTVVAGGTIVSGRLYQAGNFTGVATGNAESGEEYELFLNGVVLVPNTDSIASTQGASIGYVEATHKVVAQGTGDFDVDLFNVLASGDVNAEILLPKGGF